MALSKHLDVITLEYTEGTGAPTGGEGSDAPPNLCEHCELGQHHLCTGIECYRCPRENHPRLPGVAATMDRASSKTVGR